MEFIKHLEETPESKQLKALYGENYENMGFRQLKPLVTKEGVGLSIQANFGTYCSPRKTIELNRYKCMEVAVIKNGKFVTVWDVTNHSFIAKRFEQYFDGSIYSYVPVELIEDLYQNLF